jgi:protein-S-isoprenylcysteine O-methyltransferase Ste14
MLGIGMLLLLLVLVIIKKMATGSIIKDRPRDSIWLWLVHFFNMFFLLVANPAAAILLVSGRMESLDPTRIEIGISWMLAGLEITGLGLYLSGYMLMVWALVSMGGNYQVGGSFPRFCDIIVLTGPYRIMRHPMYAAALFISLGVALLIQSLAFLAVFLIYMILIILLIPFEEKGLLCVYGETYRMYQRKVRRIIPYVY